MKDQYLMGFVYLGTLTIVWLTYLVTVRKNPPGVARMQVVTKNPRYTFFRREPRSVCIYHLTYMVKGDIALINVANCDWCKRKIA